MVVVTVDRRWGSETQEDLRIFAVFLILLNDDVNDKMLADTSNNWPESFLQLPVNTVVEHVEQHDGLVSDTDVTVALELHKNCLLYTSPSPRDVEESRMPSSA